MEMISVDLLTCGPDALAAIIITLFLAVLVVRGIRSADNGANSPEEFAPGSETALFPQPKGEPAEHVLGPDLLTEGQAGEDIDQE